MAYTDFLNLLYPLIRSILKRKLGPIVDHEDLTQECLIGIHKNLGTYHPSRPLKPWISAIIRYKVADYFTLLAKRQEQPLKEYTLNVTNTATNKNDDVSDQSSEVMAMLSTLPGKLRKAVMLTQIEEIPYAEVAKQEGISEVALRKRISRAYAELRAFAMKDMEMSFTDGKK